MEPSRSTIISEKELNNFATSNTLSYFQTLELKADLSAHEKPDIRRQTLDSQLNKKYANSLAVIIAEQSEL